VQLCFRAVWLPYPPRLFRAARCRQPGPAGRGSGSAYTTWREPFTAAGLSGAKGSSTIVSVGFRLRRSQQPDGEERRRVRAAEQTGLAEWPLTPVGRSRWRMSKRVASGGFGLEMLVPVGEVVSDWSEVLTLSSQFLGGPVRLRDVADNSESHLRSRAGNGDLQFGVGHDDGSDLVYSWTLVGNALIEDQFEVTLVQQREGTLHAVRYAARAQPSAQLIERAVEFVLSVPERPALGIEFYDNRDIRRATGTEIEALLARLAEPLGPLDQIQPREHYRECLAAVDRSEAPELWAAVSALAGMQLLRSPYLLAREDALRCATVALRRSLEVAGPGEEMWTRAVRSLGEAYVGLASLGDDGAPEAAEYALRTAGASFTGQGHAADAALVCDSLARLRLITAAGPAEVREAGDLLEGAAAALREVGEPLEWAQAQIRLGDAHAALGRSLGSGPEAELAMARARESWLVVHRRLTTDQAFTHTDPVETSGFIRDVDDRVQRLDRDGIREPLIAHPPEGERRGVLVYLRPLESAGRLRVPNRFRNPSALAVRFAVEPDPISVEAALYRVLMPYYEFESIGGGVDGLGATRVYVPGGEAWQSFFAAMIAFASLVVVMPQASEGVRWEIDQLRSLRMLARCLFVFPPVSLDLDSAKLIASGCELLGQLGIERPAYDRDGLLFGVSDDGKLRQVFSFDEVWNDTLKDRLAAWPR
jgi:hypothetical protein